METDRRFALSILIIKSLILTFQMKWGLVFTNYKVSRCSINLVQGCLANLDAGNSDDFLGKSLKLIFVRFSTFFQFLTA